MDQHWQNVIYLLNALYTLKTNETQFNSFKYHGSLLSKYLDNRRLLSFIILINISTDHDFTVLTLVKTKYISFTRNYLIVKRKKIIMLTYVSN